MPAAAKRLEGNGGRTEVVGAELAVIPEKGGGGTGMYWKGGRYPPPSSAPGLCPVTVPLTPSGGCNGICNRQ